ncbi:MAG: hypothetical protein HY813_01365 [Candidatus Portnoybacteria bacterium]|nr:hypothetical protein [Candidatus Portnoybacteria bacterium]
MSKFKYFAFLAVLVIGAVGFLVYAQNEDTTPPAAISVLAVSTTTISSITLTWTAIADVPSTGTTTSYDARYSTATITNDNWASTTQAINEPTPHAPGTAEAITISGLASSTTYYFAIKSKDALGNESLLSNIASGTTLSPATPIPTPVPSSTFKMVVAPLVLNPKSHGQWVTVKLFFPTRYKVSDIDYASIRLNGSLKPEARFKGFDLFDDIWSKFVKERAVSNLSLKFSRPGLINLIGSTTGSYDLTLTGTIGGAGFSATDKIKIINFTSASDRTLIMSTTSPAVYIILNGRLLHIPSAEAFGRHGYKWQNIKKISADELESYSTADLIKAGDSADVYLVVGGMKRHILSADVFNSYGFDWNDIATVSTTTLTDYPGVQLIKLAGDAKVYLLSGGKKHWISSASVFEKRKFNWNAVVIVNNVEADAIPTGENVQ